MEGLSYFLINQAFWHISAFTFNISLFYWQSLVLFEIKLKQETFIDLDRFIDFNDLSVLGRIVSVENF